MQSIFAFQTAKNAEYSIVKKNVEDVFLPDMETMEEQDKDQLAIDQKAAGEAFDKAYKSDLKTIAKDYKEEIVAAVKQGQVSYKNIISENKRAYKKRLLADTNKIYTQYLSILALPMELLHIAKQERQKKGIETFNLKSNRILDLVSKSNEFERECLKHNISWQNNQSELRTWYKECLRKDETYIEYDEKERIGFEDDKQIVLHIFKKIIFKDENIGKFFEEKDLNWSENSSILKSMVAKSIKSFESENDELILMALSKNWDEDLLFLKEIFDYTVNNEEDYELIIAEKSKNWDIDRVALTDKIILEMAVAEMLNFPSIPVKVTINEYIELSKLYSTPKSKQFVNGILDVLSEELKLDGKIKKSGRGLLDNK
jgi:N utilization substance protein B